MHCGCNWKQVLIGYIVIKMNSENSFLDILELYLVCQKGVFVMNEKEQKETKAEEERIRENGQVTLEENGKRIHLLSIIGGDRRA